MRSSHFTGMMNLWTRLGLLAGLTILTAVFNIFDGILPNMWTL